ncbi:MAG: LCP family protein [Selenomonadaceae bacterium]|nr:LCP family protein [Selenomonadaceae bacterium]
MSMESQTKLNVQRKRKVLRKKRRIKYFRVFVFLILLGCALTAAGWVSMQLYGWASQTCAVYAEIYDDYKQRRALRAASFDPRFDGYTNILFVGLDTGREDTGQQADNLFLLSFRHEDGAVRIISIPRYTLAEIPGIQQPQRLNNAYHYGGIPLLEQTVTGLLGVTVHHYVAIDIEALKELVDVMGGIDVYVETSMDYEDPEGDLYIHIPKGYQHMDGDTAQKYLRFSSDELGAYGRSKRQQAFVKAVYQRVLQPDVITRLPLLLDVWQRRAVTTIEAFDSAHFTNLLRKLSGTMPEMVLLPGGWDANGSWVCDKAAAEAKMAELFPAEPEPEEDKGFLGIF